MKKDPAFLFYSTSFYEGTRTMLPEERACYIDLLIYQHQHGFIPDDVRRLTMYCSGINEATLKATLEAKFKLCDKGWINQRLFDAMEVLHGFKPYLFPVEGIFRVEKDPAEYKFPEGWLRVDKTIPPYLRQRIPNQGQSSH